ncbi:MAG: hypothetical protein ACR2OZ_10330 [Verrucomicrobiales bacterium]
MRKTARPVVWEGCGAQSPQPDPIPSHTGQDAGHTMIVAETNFSWMH